ncbi:MFS transporter [Polaribacter aestuariivivens]|uniref:ADP,ATP carrier protein n=1 Tax=Polaribacter aestuariivivens TaxID=2304626 RepID=A0A5S3N0I0_9FLAO|nr:Npt1/Npt2 family nucleotide transporter [Polaribacter aestuariivivens]TMM28653.1 MFS transporter [Polaribacter aestuariivivens]
MKKILSKTFGLRDGEIYISFLMQLYIFIVITVLLIVKPTVNALFVSKLGADNLPFGYLLVAFVAVSTSYFYNRAIRKLSLVKVAIISLVIFSLAFLGLSIILKFSLTSNWLLYFYYVFISLFAVIATSQFWIFANMVFNAREAKRIFGFIGAGAIAGGIFGGYLTSIIASNFGTEAAIFIAAILLLGCIPIIKKVYELRIKYLNTFKRKQVIAKQDTLESSSIKLIANSKHLTYIAFITGIGVIVAKLVDFQFSDFAHKAIPNSDDLAAFFGFWFSTFNVVALTIQLFLTNKILTKLGVSSTLLILPLAIGLGSLLFLTFPELWVLVLIKGIDGSFKQSINKASVELSIMPIPILIKNQAKSYIDVAVDSIATGIAGFLLIFLIKRLDLETTYITVIILLFVFIWIVLIYRLREAYFNSFKKNIQKTLLSENDDKKANKENSITHIKRILESGKEESILEVISRLNDFNSKIFQKSVIKLLKHPSNKVKIQAIDFLHNIEDTSILNNIKPLVYEKDDTLVYVALEYILENSHINEDSFFVKYLDHENEYIANGALMALAKQNSRNSILGLKYNLKDRLNNKIHLFKAEENTVRKEVIAGLLISIANARMVTHYHYIQENLSNRKSYIVKFATIAAGITSDELFIEDLLNLTAKKKHRKRAIKALKSYGPKIIDSILKLDKEDDIKGNIKKYVPKIIESFNNENAVKILIRLLKNKNSVTRLAASNSLAKLKKKSSNLLITRKLIKNQIVRESNYYRNILEIITSIQHVINEELVDEKSSAEQQIYEARKNLITALEHELENTLESLFKLLSMLYNEEDINMTFVGIKSEIKEAKINSLEFLDNLLQAEVKTKVLPIVEYYVVDDKHYNSPIIELSLLTEKKYLEKIMRMGGSHLRFLIVELIAASKNKNYIPVLLPIKKYRSKKVKKLASDTYNNFMGFSKN